MADKLKILYIVEAMGGGVFSYIADLANELINEYDMYIAYAVRPQTPKDYKNYFNKGIYLIEVKSFRRSINPVQDLKSLIEVKAIAKKVNPDIIHLHSSKAGVIGRLAFDGKKILVFYTPHGYSFLMRNYKPTKRMMFKIIETLCTKRKCTTISCSDGEHKETLKLTKRAVRVNNAVNTNHLQKMLEQVEVKAHPFTVFTLGRICYQKNPELFNKVAEAMPDVKFLWIGEGELREQLKASNIEITGWVEREDALSMSMNADVFILTSIWEGLPISLLESMYMRKPCVVNNSIGNNDVIHNGDNGYVCDSVEDFVRSINEIREGQAQAYVDKAYMDMLELYDSKTQAREYSEIYKVKSGEQNVKGKNNMITPREIEQRTMSPDKRKSARNDYFAFYVGRTLSYVLTIPFLYTNISPNAVSLISIVPILIGFLTMSIAHNKCGLAIGWFCFFLWNLLDGVDGNIARYKKKFTPFGSVYDAMSGYIAMVLSFFAWGIAASHNPGVVEGLIEIPREVYTILGGLSGVFVIFPRLIMHKSITTLNDEQRVSGVKNREDYSIPKIIALNLTSVSGFVQVLMLIAILCNALDIFTLGYFLLNFCVMIVSLGSIFKGK